MRLPTRRIAFSIGDAISNRGESSNKSLSFKAFWAKESTIILDMKVREKIGMTIVG